MTAKWIKQAGDRRYFYGQKIAVCRRGIRPPYLDPPLNVIVAGCRVLVPQTSCTHARSTNGSVKCQYTVLNAAVICICVAWSSRLQLLWTLLDDFYQFDTSNFSQSEFYSYWWDNLVVL